MDFVLSVGQFSMIIEAKRIGKTFGKLPTSRKVFIKGQISTGITKDAIVQARDYGRSRGSRFAVVTNGLSWIIFFELDRALRSAERNYAISDAALPLFVSTRQ